MGNSVSIYAFTRPSVRGLSTFKFLAYLSLIDQLYLIVGLSHILVIAYLDYDFRNYSNFVCSVHSFLTLYLSHLSSNILAAVGVFRCVTLTTLRPLKPAVRVVKNSSSPNAGGVGAVTMTAAATLPAVAAAAATLTHVSPTLMSNNRTTINGHSHISPNHSLSPKCQTKVVYSRSSQSEGCILKRIISNFDNADLVVAAIAFVIFLFDCHFLVLMRLDLIEIGSEIVNVTIALNATNHSNSSTNMNATAATTMTRQVVQKQHILTCYPSPERSKIYFEFYTQVYPWIDQFMYSYIPFGIMIVSTIIIIHRLFTINKQLKTTTKSVTTHNHHNHHNQQQQQKNQHLPSASNTNAITTTTTNITNSTNSPPKTSNGIFLPSYLKSLLFIHFMCIVLFVLNYLLFNNKKISKKTLKCRHTFVE